MTDKLEELLELERDMVNNECHGNMKKKQINRMNKLKKEIQHDLLLANELRSTHNFYTTQKLMGSAAGVTGQILALSNYGGRLFSKEELES